MATGALIGALRVTLGLDSAAFEKGANQMSAKLSGVSKSFVSAGKKMAVVGTVMTAAVTAPFIALVKASIPAAIESQQAIAQVNAALKSMGPVAGRTSEQLTGLAGKLQDISLFDDDDILKQVTANLLTFGAVAGDVFDRAQQVIVDYSARTGRDLQATTIMIGKALQDPVKGVTALQKAGVKLTDQQKEQVKAMIAVGNVAGAQAIVLGELEREYKGSAKAQRDATPGAAVQQQWRTFQETLGGIALKILPPLNNALASLLGWFNNLSPAGQNFALAVAAIAAAAGPVTTAVGGLAIAFGKIVPMFAGGALLGEGGAMAAAGAAGGPLLLVAAGAGAAYLAFQRWPQIQSWVQGVADRFAALRAENDKLAKSSEGTKRWAADMQTVLNTKISSGPGTAGSSQWQLQYAKDIKAFLNYDITAWAYRTQDAITKFCADSWHAFEQFHARAQAAFDRLIMGIGQAVYGKMQAIWTRLKSMVSEAGDWFHTLWDRVVGHSYIPDMVDQIGVEIARLEGNMVFPIERATKKAADAFKQLRETVGGILDRLFPEQADIRAKEAELEQLGTALAKKMITPEIYAAARRRILAELDQLMADIAAKAALKDSEIAPKDESMGLDPEGDLERVTHEILVAGGMATDGAKKHKAANDNIIQSYAQMAASVADSIRGLVGDIKSGDWLSVLSDVADLVAQVLGAFKGSGGGGSGGLFGGGMSFGGARASGGPVRSGRTYLVGERGPELFTPSGSGSIISNGAMRGSAPNVVTVHVVANDYFDAKVGSISGNTAVQIGGEYQRRVSRSNRQSLLR